jgi:hypothetical protein
MINESSSICDISKSGTSHHVLFWFFEFCF